MPSSIGLLREHADYTKPYLEIHSSDSTPHWRMIIGGDDLVEMWTFSAPLCSRAGRRVTLRTGECERTAERWTRSVRIVC